MIRCVSRFCLVFMFSCNTADVDCDFFFLINKQPITSQPFTKLNGVEIRCRMCCAFHLMLILYI